MTPTRPQLIVAACFGAFLVFAPLALEKPGLPMSLRGTEPNHLGAALSVGLDGDLLCEPRDVHRLFQEFPYTPPIRLRLDDSEPTSPSFEADPLYSAVAALPARLLGANGLVALNALCFLGILALCGLSRRSQGGEKEAGPGLFFTTVFLITGAAFLQIFQIGPALLTAFWVALGLRLYLETEDGDARETTRLASSGAALGAAAFSSPWILAPMAALLLALRRRAWPWLLGLACGLAAVTLVSAVLDTPSGPSAVYELASPYETPWIEGDALPASPSQLGARAVSSTQEAWNRFTFTLLDRRSGLLAYLPGLIPLLLAALWEGRRRDTSPWPAKSWIWAGGLALFIGVQGFSPPPELGAGRVGHPAWVVLSPALLLLLARPPAGWVSLVTVALGVLTLGPAQVSTLGGAMAYADAQGHSRGAVLARLPLDPASVGLADGYRELPVGGPADLHGRLFIPKHLSEVHGDEAWLLGNSRSSLYLTTARPLEDAVFQIRTLGTPNEIQVTFAGRREILSFPETGPQGSSTRLHFRNLEGRGAHRLLKEPSGDREIWLYRLDVTSSRGFKPNWNGNSHVTFYLGAAAAFLGPQDFLEADLYAAAFEACDAPPTVHAGDHFLAAVTVQNTSSSPWPVGGAVEVRLGYRWLDPAGETVSEGERTDLPGPGVEPGETVTSWVEVVAPRRPGTFQLEIDPIYENVAWFSHRGSATCSVDVQILPPRPEEPVSPDF